MIAKFGIHRSSVQIDFVTLPKFFFVYESQNYKEKNGICIL
jgi:hypothetical protein